MHRRTSARPRRTSGGKNSKHLRAGPWTRNAGYSTRSSATPGTRRRTTRRVYAIPMTKLRMTGAFVIHVIASHAYVACRTLAW